MYKDKEKKRDNDRKQMKVKYGRYKTKRAELIIQFGSKCWVCDGDYLLQFHHLEYGELGKLGHASMWRRIQHLREIEQFPERFKLLCGKCHSVVTFTGDRLKKYPRLYELM